NPEEVKKQFQKILQGTDALDISKIEEELINEGMPKEEIQRLCAVHLAVFKESLEKEKSIAPPGHPIYILMEEHRIMLNFAHELQETAKKMKQAKDYSTASDSMEHLQHLATHFQDSDKHYLREENVLFPYLEKHGITQPPAIMWSEHDKIRETKKQLYQLINSYQETVFPEFVKKLELEIAITLVDLLTSHFYKENNVLFPTGLRVITAEEWLEIREQFDELGYCSFTPDLARVPFATKPAGAPAAIKGEEGLLPFATGKLSAEEIESIFNSLPVDITFVDKDDAVKYFSNGKERIFVRTTAVLGRNVKNCHPQKSIHVVNQILDEFKSGKRDSAAFWINLGGKLIYIRYFAVRNEKGEYLGCLEVSQDITEIKRLEGEKKLL
ncbi:MAG: DUF438 domain-containing protein, partial [bacterium]|nr:DUF438 domain-containing protein [bacterium]